MTAIDFSQLIYQETLVYASLHAPHTIETYAWTKPSTEKHTVVAKWFVPTQLHQFERERDIITAAESHENIIQLLGTTKRSLDGVEQVGLVLPKFDTSLDRILSRMRQSQVVSMDKLFIMSQLALGLAWLHSRNIHHGNIQPAKILINDGDSAVFIGFGTSRVLAGDETHITQHAARISEAYCPPHAFNPDLLPTPNKPDQPDVHVCSKFDDVYSLGIVFFELCTHVRQQRSTNLNRAHGKATDNWAAIENESLRQLIQHMMNLNPRQRPTAGQVVARLNVLLP